MRSPASSRRARTASRPATPPPTTSTWYAAACPERLMGEHDASPGPVPRQSVRCIEIRRSPKPEAAHSRTRSSASETIFPESMDSLDSEVDVDRICTLEQALERVGPCGRSECSFWLTDKGSERCVLEGVERELLARPPVASYLLALRHRL